MPPVGTDDSNKNGRLPMAGLGWAFCTLGSGLVLIVMIFLYGADKVLRQTVRSASQRRQTPLSLSGLCRFRSFAAPGKVHVYLSCPNRTFKIVFSCRWFPDAERYIKRRVAILVGRKSAAIMDAVSQKSTGHRARRKGCARARVSEIGVPAWVSAKDAL